MRKRLLVMAAAFVLGLVGLGATAFAGDDPGVFPPWSHPYGHSYAEWQARWFQWMTSIPVSENPGFDETGERCGVGQTGHVWFTSFVTHDGTTERTCEVPRGTALFVLVSGYECATPQGDPEASLQACATGGFDSSNAGSTFSVTVDGSRVRHLQRFRTATAVYPISLPEDNVYGVPAGPGLQASDGIFVMLTPFSVGRHRIEIHLDVPGFVAEENYTIVVKPKRR